MGRKSFAQESPNPWDAGNVETRPQPCGTRPQPCGTRPRGTLENTSKEFDGYCRQEGIRRQLTVPYTPKQNGVAQRKNKSNVGAVKAMLLDQSLPFFLWVEACSTVLYLQNRSPHCAMGNMTPEECFSSKKPEVSHFRYLVV